MPPDGDQTLAARLLASTAVAALSQEKRIASTVAKSGWAVSHGVYYEDGETKKRREIDVVATRRWVKGAGIAVLKLVIECKSASEWNVVFVPSSPTHVSCVLPAWSITDNAISSAVMRHLISLGVGESAAADARKALLKGFSRSTRLDLDVQPPTLEPLASGFVETNIGQTKDPEAAVTWKAVQATNSAIASFGAMETASRANDIAAGLRLMINEEEQRPGPLEECARVVGTRKILRGNFHGQAISWGSYLENLLRVERYVDLPDATPNFTTSHGSWRRSKTHLGT